MSARVLVVGATGFFGSRLAAGLAARGHDVIAAGRSQERLDSWAQGTDMATCQMARNDPRQVAAALSAHAPDVVIDASGPFQNYGDDPYEFATTVIGAGCHYLDLADARNFVANFRELDDLAQKMGVVARAGVSTTPTIVVASATALAKGFDRIETVETTIAPGNRTDRGRSVIAAILGQVGEPFNATLGGKQVEQRGWGNSRKQLIQVGEQRIQRNAALINTPDLDVVLDHLAARSISLNAGLELGIMHQALSIAGWFRARGVVGNMAKMTPLVLWLAHRMRAIGSDLGGMKVCVTGQQQGKWRKREWHLLAPDGAGPNIPVQPAIAYVESIMAGQVCAGAAPGAGELSLEEIETLMSEFGVKTQVHESAQVPLFRTVLKDDFEVLAPGVRDLHNNIGVAHYLGRAKVTGPETILGKIAGRIAGFPPAGRDVRVGVTIEAAAGAEVWERRFDEKRFRSYLSHDDGRAFERFGALTFELGLNVKDKALWFPIRAGRFAGFIPLPKFLLPRSVTKEAIDAQGRFTFDVQISLPIGGRIVRYQGWLERESG